MTSQPSPSFNQWVMHYFAPDYGEIDGDEAHNAKARGELDARFLGIDPALKTTYLTRLFESPAFLAETFTHEQIAETVRYMFSGNLPFIAEDGRPGLAPELEARCVRAISTLYTDLFDRICGRGGTDPDSDLRFEVKLDNAVHLIWDMGNLERMLIFPAKSPHLVAPTIEVLDIILRRCRTGACRSSALVGIETGIAMNGRSDEHGVAARLQAVLATFLKRDDLPGWQRASAERLCG